MKLQRPHEAAVISPRGSQQQALPEQQGNKLLRLFLMYLFPSSLSQEKKEQCC